MGGTANTLHIAYICQASPSVYLCSLNEHSSVGRKTIGFLSDSLGSTTYLLVYKEERKQVLVESIKVQFFFLHFAPTLSMLTYHLQNPNHNHLKLCKMTT